ncbi:Site-specific recombinase XerD [Mucilaginibacter mallensis]|uniref:Site-specific recombinase XerD n=1 Tax=Mucilaginibacter mallensis TaxID=652787 RepID=A0A1H2ADF8_MUCMA|nr:site-specific integrase [Mucilaginibacter mallensis]SDT43934.1 Site-specific recombinase XerD [Mucilaginibacter mallensis]
MKAEVSLYLDTRRALKNGTFPLKLHVYFTAKMERWYGTDYKLSQFTFEQSYLASKPRGENKDLKIELDAIVQKGAELAKALGDNFTFEKFERKMFRSKASTNNVIEHFASAVKILEKNEQIGTASSYDCSIKSITTYLSEGKKNPVTHISFSLLTAETLNKYEQWMIAKDCSKTTVGIYMRNLRAIFNKAIAAGDIAPELYPFKTYKIPTGKNVKKALETPDLNTLYTTDVTADSFIEKARDFWFFSYQCNGMNFRDIAELKFKDIHDTYFSFLRHKTKNTTKEDPSPIVVPLTGYVKDFIQKYANKKGKPNDYLFPIFQTGMSAKERHKVNQNFIRFVNQHMQKLVDQLGLSFRLGTMVARHTFTTQATRTMGLEFAQEALGHTTMNTTQNYWKGFESEAKKTMADKLMEFASVKQKADQVEIEVPA